jgi:hypothetical protein
MVHVTIQVLTDNDNGAAAVGAVVNRQYQVADTST